MTSASNELADAVRKRGNIRIDTRALADHAVRVLDESLIRAVQAPVARVERAMSDVVTRASSLGATATQAAIDRCEGAISEIRILNATLSSAESRVTRLSSRLTWVAAGRLALTLLPAVAVALVIAILLGGAFQAVGAGPLLGWAWDSFARADLWWQKALIAVGALGGVASFCVLVGWIVRRIGSSYRRW